MGMLRMCDRHKTPIADGSDYLPVKVKQANNEWLDVDLCQQCGMEFKAWLNANAAAPVNPAAQPAQPGQPIAA